MKKTLILPVLAFLVACGPQSKIEAKIKDQLKDPESAQFRGLVSSKSGKYACIEWNAKNSMGGYANWQLAEMEKTLDGWRVINLDGSQYNCTADQFKFVDHMDQVLGKP